MNIAKFLSMFGHFSTLYIKGLNLIAFTCIDYGGIIHKNKLSAFSIIQEHLEKHQY